MPPDESRPDDSSTNTTIKMPTTFLDLPPELRNRIYFLSTDLVPTAFIPPSSHDPKFPNRSVWVSNRELKNSRIYIDCTCKGCWSKLVQPAITRVSRGVRSETLSIFYGTNKYHLNTERIGRWLRAIELHMHLFDEVKLGPRCRSPQMVNGLLDLDLKLDL